MQRLTFSIGCNSAVQRGVLIAELRTCRALNSCIVSRAGDGRRAPDDERRFLLAKFDWRAESRRTEKSRGAIWEWISSVWVSAVALISFKTFCEESNRAVFFHRLARRWSIIESDSLVTLNGLV